MMSSPHEEIVFGGGCFWCVEAVFQKLDGVLEVQSGYAGGTTVNPTYKEVCGKDTGHAEVVRVRFDPARGDPRAGPRAVLARPRSDHAQPAGRGQGPAVYRSIILPATPEQRAVAEHSRAEAAKLFAAPIVTEIKPLERFYPAEPEHQDFYRRNGSNPYCVFNIDPKLKKLGLS